MGFDWVIVHIVAILAETFACIYFLHSRYAPKFSNHAPEIICGAAIISWWAISYFTGLQIYDYGFVLLLSAYIFATKLGGFIHKLIGVTLLLAIMLGTSLAGAGIVAAFMGTTIEATLETQDTSRLVALIFIKTIQVSLLYLLSKKHIPIRELGKIPTTIIGLVTAIIFMFVMVLRASLDAPNADDGHGGLLVLTSIVLLLITIAVFLMNELFVKEEAKNANLAMSLQRMELERGFFNEIDTIYKDIRAWRHEYRNNLIALRDLIHLEDKEKILAYIDKISGEPLQFETTLQTGNLILDAIVSSKLGLAQSKGIEVSVQAVYPKSNTIEDNDLCTIVGNLLDNAIEACNEAELSSERKYVDFSFLAKGKNLVISVKNSYFHEVKLDNGRYVSIKGGLFHGIGVPLLDSVVHKYNGHVLRSHDKGVFETNIIIPLVQPYGAEQDTGKEVGNV